MAYEMKAGWGSAFGNDQKKEDWHADFRGKVMLPDDTGGQVRFLDVYRKKDKNGKEYFTVKIGNLMTGQAHLAKPAGGVKEMKDDIPW